MGGREKEGVGRDGGRCVDFRLMDYNFLTNYCREWLFYTEFFRREAANDHV